MMLNVSVSLVTIVIRKKCVLVLVSNYEFPKPKALCYAYSISNIGTFNNSLLMRDERMNEDAIRCIGRTARGPVSVDATQLESGTSMENPADGCRVCRICWVSLEKDDPDVVSPCRCKGSMVRGVLSRAQTAGCHKGTHGVPSLSTLIEIWTV